MAKTDITRLCRDPDRRVAGGWIGTASAGDGLTCENAEEKAEPAIVPLSDRTDPQSGAPRQLELSVDAEET
jgi:hypothetical protein